ncbi:MAG: RNA polymerase sigma factor RpoD/SigA [Nannocystaceae bacterium]|nr:sigma-70 family RNA polymerase sigma factor [bacterium]
MTAQKGETSPKSGNSAEASKETSAPKSGRGRGRRGRVSPSDPGDDASALGIYFREMAAVSVMTPQQEREAAEQILDARTKYWRAIFSYPPFIPGIAAVVCDTFNEDDRPGELLESIQRTSRKYRDRQTRANEDAYELDCQKLSGEMARLDTDGLACEPVFEDLNNILEGRRNDVKLQVTLPPTGSAPFAKYVDRVRTAGAVLWRRKDQFVRANLRLVVTMARRYNRGALPLPDLIQEGNIGLMKAVDRFDPERGFRFSTYASWWIRHAISRALADKGREVRVPVHMIDVYHKLKRTRQRFATLKGREPTDEELSQQAEVPIEKIQRLRQCLLDAGPSLDSPVSGAEGRTVGELIEDETTPLPAEMLQARAMGDKVRELLDRLRPIEADVIRKRFGLDQGEPMTLREIGEQYSLSRERIRQLQEQALIKIRRELRRQDLM